MAQVSAHWNLFDYVIVGVVLLSVIVGFFRGFLREAISLATLFFAFYAALKFSYVISGMFHFVSNPRLEYILSAIVTFIVVMVLGAMINKVAGGLLMATGLGIFDKLLGLGFGAARGLLFVTIMLLAIQVTRMDNLAWVQQSDLAPRFQPIVTYFSGMLPKELTNVTAWMQTLSIKKLT